MNERNQNICDIIPILLASLKNVINKFTLYLGIPIFSQEITITEIKIHLLWDLIKK